MGKQRSSRAFEGDAESSALDRNARGSRSTSSGFVYSAASRGRNRRHPHPRTVA